MSFSILISFALILTAYLLGSIPTGYLAGRILKGIDIREHGSGSTGATNVLRTVGKGAAIGVLLVDLVKGMMAIALIKMITNSLGGNVLQWQEWLVMTGALLAVLGHSKSVWLKFSGGKSAAISLGVLFVMNPFVGLGTLATFLIVLYFSRIVSLSSLSGAIAVSVFMAIFNPSIPYLTFALLAGLYVIIRHRTNIQRLMAGKEPRIGQAVTP
ncbi:glycerol-3-phosphate 1-O-acyltransferase PlsY [Cyanobacterium stanieri LEGE 03274]|uniref:Glycerol-3-phosphate acyltransferase n=1 Tax=Cyanobacterium stanieri LEGE 03274 TaxID=1828756 RepID=A0ABR9V6Z9_9CHRO|nr:glycerol-3-phosphate 1-O-acyltransferase PlsY [Cyanobacterium stanieri]MBE9223276.1 glycerol-3-phosphate 1-O-acyltransferase PlsY [Cyanobacterium stanieri LEGE 03274]